jgi:iron-sulfur cluster insertion protein
MIAATEKAIVKIKEISDSEGIGHYNIRLKVIGGGCAGFSYDMFYEENVTPMDETSEIDGITIVVDPLSFQYLDGVEIDYVTNHLGAGFKFINPNVKSTCGCGSSFSA